MNRRLLDVNAYTTFDYLDARAHGVGWTDEAVAVLDVDTPEGEGTVSLKVELDPGDLIHLEHHADHVRLTPTEARALAVTLGNAADRAETEDGQDSVGGEEDTAPGASPSQESE